MQTKTKPADRKILLAALQCAGKRPWPQVTLAEIAKTAKLAIKDVEKIYPDANAIASAVVAYIDEQTMAAIGKPELNDEPRDRLFEILMARFDIMQQHRAGILSIAAASRQSPSLGIAVLRRQWQSISAMLGAAGLKDSKCGPLQTVALLAIYHDALRCWMHDGSRDMAKTMARLDRSLRYAAKLAEVIPCNRQA